MARVRWQSWSRVVPVGLALVCACAPGDDLTPGRIRWTPRADLDARLPPGLRVLALQTWNPPLRAFAVLVKESDPAIRTRVVVSDDDDGRETLSELARQEAGARVVINAGYFDAQPGRTHAVGLLVSGGRMRHVAADYVTRGDVRYACARGALGIDADDHPDIAWALSRDGAVYRVDAPPDNAPGRPADPPGDEQRREWPVVDAVQAGPVLVQDGRVRVTADQEVFFGTTITTVHPRTAVGVTRDGGLVFLVVDGRQPRSRGVDLQELAVLMVDLGCERALNLDGGGSSAIVVDGELLNEPAGSDEEREVMSGLAVFVEAATEGR